MISTTHLNPEHLKAFREQGFLQLNPEGELIDLVDNLISSLEEFGILFSGDTNFNLQQSAMVEEANRLGFYKYIRHLNELYSLMGSSTIRSVAKFLGVQIPSLGPSGIRLDICQESSHQFGWHQDAPSLLGSINMFTYWIPCTDVNGELGTIELIPGSHNMLHLKTLDARDKHLASKQESFNLILEPEYARKHGDSILINAKKGSIVVLHPLIIHRSYYPSKVHPARVTAIARIDDAGDPDHLALGLKTAIDGFNIFNTPEYIDYYSKFCLIAK
jgi:hypothetical protein